VEPRTAPQWIREAERRYQWAHRMWVCVTAAALLGWTGRAFIEVSPHTSWGRALAVVCVVVFVVWRPDERATRSGAAANAVNAAIARYEVSANRRARETARVERIRTAPAPIRDKRRHYRLGMLGWYSPLLLAVALAQAAIVLRWSWVRPWHASAVLLPLLVGCLLGARKPVAEGDPEAADRRASGVLAGVIRGF
jgi:hypothetical protein